MIFHKHGKCLNFPRVLLVALVMVFGRIIGSAPSNHVFGTKVENFARLWLVLSLGHPEFFPTGFRAKVREAHRKERRYFLPATCAAIPRCAIFFVYAARTRLSANWATRVYAAEEHLTHDFMTLFFTISWVLFYYDFSSIVHFQGYICFVFKSTLECFFTSFEALSDFKAWLWNVQRL